MAVIIENPSLNIKQLSCNELFLSGFLVSWWIRADFPQFSLSLVSYIGGFYGIVPDSFSSYQIAKTNPKEALWMYE